MDLIDWHRPPPVPHLSPSNRYSDGFLSGALTEVIPDIASVPNIAFICTDASTGSPVVTYKVNVADGEINGVLPSGMGEGLTLTILNPTDVFVYAKIDFDPATLNITSRQILVANVADLPVSNIDPVTGGHLFVVLAEAFLDDSVPPVFQVINRRVGDIDFEIIYGQNAGVASTLAVAKYGDWMNIPDPV